jgi:hypothetical protein
MGTLVSPGSPKPGLLTPSRGRSAVAERMALTNFGPLILIIVDRVFPPADPHAHVAHEHNAA